MITETRFNFSDIEECLFKKYSSSFTLSDSNNQPSSSGNLPFSAVIPPPNVTGRLHIGHALCLTIEDAMVKYKRLRNFTSSWIPGTDHAGIATQMLVTKQLESQGVESSKITKDFLIDKIWEWKESSGSSIIHQMKKMGYSCSWDKEAFTMSKELSESVNYAFNKLYKDGLIYKDSRLVNWDTKLKTAISDLEVEQKEVKGKFYYIKYFNKDKTKHIVVATTRPETIIADTALAVALDDERYKDLVGKEEFVIPLFNRSIPVIADLHADKEKGTGVVKITPAHDFNDFEVGKRHNLEVINILNKDGTLNSNVPKSYQGLTVEKAREKVVKELEEQGYLEKIESKVIQVPKGDRSGTTIEPLLTSQWYLNVAKLAPKAINAVKNGDIKFTPANWQNLYFDWMNKIEPWCISRQLWWGHQIPAWYSEEGDIFVAKNEQEANEQAIKKYGKEVQLTRDEDVLDTWFSSSLWPFATLGWQSEKTIPTNYPHDFLATGFDIIFFWVARMIMMSLYFTDKVPFKNVYITPLIRDEKGQKMSKTKGNVIDPLEVSKKYGTDAFRFAVLSAPLQGQDVRMSEKTIESCMKFVTKIFNASRFVINSGAYYSKTFNPANVNVDANAWILHKFKETVERFDESFEKYRFFDASSAIYRFFWNDFCDWYIELLKPILLQEGNEEQKDEVKQTAGYILKHFMVILNPIMPFISQYIHEELLQEQTDISKQQAISHKSITTIPFKVKQVETFVEIIAKIRSLRASLNIPNSSLIKVYLNNLNDDALSSINLNEKIICSLAKLEAIHKNVDCNESNTVKDIIKEATIQIPLEGLIDINAEKQRLLKNIDKISKEKTSLERRLNNPQFVEKAKKEVVEQNKIELLDLENKLKDLNSLLSSFN